MNGIENEVRRLLEMAASGELPGYPQSDTEKSFFAADAVSSGMAEYFSGENDAVERRLRTLWADEPQMQKCIPVVLAAVEKSRGQESHAVVRTELYNYSM